MKPGITGLWQVEARLDEFDRRAALDLSYIDGWSVWLDMKISSGRSRQCSRVPGDSVRWRVGTASAMVWVGVEYRAVFRSVRFLRGGSRMASGGAPAYRH